MPKKISLGWYDGLLKKAGIPYPIIGLIIGIIIYLIYLFLGIMLELEWDQEDKIIFMLMGILIAYQLSGVQYLLDKFKKILLDICSLTEVDEDNFCTGARSRFINSLWYYALLAVVIFPFYLTDWISFEYTLKENYTLLEQFLPNYIESPIFWVLVYDIYQNFLGFIALILLAYILWIVLNITRTLKALRVNFHSFSSNTSVFSIQMKLRPIKSSILNILFYYFICISLLILSYGLTGYIFEKIVLSILLLVGLIFFFVGYGSLVDIVRHQNEYELDKINKRSREYTQKLLAIDSNGDFGPKIEEINFISNMLDALQKQRDSLTNANTKIYDLKSIVSIIGAFILPILADIAKEHLNLIFESSDMINQGLSILKSLIIK